MKNSKTLHQDHSHQLTRASGYTLIELLIAVVILLILAGITLSALNITANNERIPGAARDIQSFIAGARDRAIFQKRPVGVRLYLDPNGVNNGNGSVTVNSMAYVATPPLLTGRLDIRQYIPGSSPLEPDLQRIVFVANDAPSLWNTIRNRRGLISQNATMQIEIRNPTTGVFSLYRMYYDSVTDSDDEGWKLSKPYDGSVLIGLPYRITLLPATLPNQTVRDLPSGVAINLESARVNNRLPSFWYSPENGGGARIVTDNGQYSNFMDIMFTPSGTGVGAASGAGMIQLHISALEDIERATEPALCLGNPRNQEPERLVTVSPITGNVSIAEIPLFTDANEDDLPDSAYDPYFYSELGYTAE